MKPAKHDLNAECKANAWSSHSSFLHGTYHPRKAFGSKQGSTPFSA
jgi:hypothetical protein